ncbi:MAG TPA: DUF3604 domain-containing protein, partial [Phenylobacterium sp.]|nr:DUF3604 domain-containing protein [Phenylobacterium sp.]
MDSHGHRPVRLLAAAAFLGALASAGSAPGQGQAPKPPPAAAKPSPAAKPAAHLPGWNPDRNAYFGDLHVHTGLSFDAYIFNVRATPEDAYRFARGEPIGHA